MKEHFPKEHGKQQQKKKKKKKKLISMISIKHAFILFVCIYHLGRTTLQQEHDILWYYTFVILYSHVIAIDVLYVKDFLLVTVGHSCDGQKGKGNRFHSTAPTTCYSWYRGWLTGRRWGSMSCSPLAHLPYFPSSQFWYSLWLSLWLFFTWVILRTFSLLFI